MMEQACLFFFFFQKTQKRTTKKISIRYLYIMSTWAVFGTLTFSMC